MWGKLPFLSKGECGLSHGQSWGGQGPNTHLMVLRLGPGEGAAPAAAVLDSHIGPKCTGL